MSSSQHTSPQNVTFLTHNTFKYLFFLTLELFQQILNLLEDTPGGSPDTKKAADVCKQLCFSPTPASTSESISPKHRRTDRSLFSSVSTAVCHAPYFQDVLKTLLKSIRLKIGTNLNPSRITLITKSGS